MKLYIKYMVSRRCKILVEEEMGKLGLYPTSVYLGMVVISGSITEQQQKELKRTLLKAGLELMDDKNRMLIERAKNLIIEMIYYFDEIPEVNYSDYISGQLKCDYAYLAKIFSEVNGITIQQFIINNKIEKAKELLVYDQLSLTEISYKLNYSSVAHLSNQFKKITGHSPSFFKEMQRIRTNNYRNVGMI
ncbi:MAG: helix-turn-helix transcriptional regulator [Haliscomenobacter sp.]|nr:helix-turn-helix transcriptional regulator [Haliscomenobacter sp.]